MASLNGVIIRAAALALASLVSSLHAYGSQVGEHRRLDDYSATRIDSEAHDRFRSEAPAEWESIRSRQKEFQVDVRTRTEFEKGRAVKRRTNAFRFSVGADQRRKLAREALGLAAAVANERYSFRVRRQADGSPFELHSCEAWGAADDQPLPGAIASIDSAFQYMSSVWWVPLDYILSNDAFKLVGVEQSFNAGGREVITVAFRYTGPRINRPYCEPNAVYWAELLPLDLWVVARSGVVGINDGQSLLRLRVSMRYQEWNEIPFPSRTLLEYEDSRTGQIIELTELHFGQPQAPGVAETEFFLPYYGIDESTVPALEGINSRWRVLVLILGGVGVLIALAALFFFRRKPTSAQAGSRRSGNSYQRPLS